MHRTQRRRSRNTRRNRRTRKQSAGAHRVFYGTITNASGNSFNNSNFLNRRTNAALNGQWEEINTVLSAHVRKHFSEEMIIREGFGGDDETGVVVVKKSTKVLPPMKFSIAGRDYTMTFDRVENRNE